MTLCEASRWAGRVKRSPFKVASWLVSAQTLLILALHGFSNGHVFRTLEKEEKLNVMVEAGVAGTSAQGPGWAIVVQRVNECER